MSPRRLLLQLFLLLALCLTASCTPEQQEAAGGDAHIIGGNEKEPVRILRRLVKLGIDGLLRGERVSSFCAAGPDAKKFLLDHAVQMRDLSALLPVAEFDGSAKAHNGQVSKIGDQKVIMLDKALLADKDASGVLRTTHQIALGALRVFVHEVGHAAYQGDQQAIESTLRIADGCLEEYILSFSPGRVDGAFGAERGVLQMTPADHTPTAMTQLENGDLIVALSSNSVSSCTLHITDEKGERAPKRIHLSPEEGNAILCNDLKPIPGNRFLVVVFDIRPNGWSLSFRVHMYEAGGSPVLAFGNNGVVKFTASGLFDYRPQRVVVAERHFYITGLAHAYQGAAVHRVLGIARVDFEGSLDETFAGGGFRSWENLGSHLTDSDAALAPNGDLIVSAQLSNFDFTGQQGYLLWLSPQGSVKAFVADAAGSSMASLLDIESASDGSIIGIMHTPERKEHFVRYSPAGARIGEFGDSGVVIPSFVPSRILRTENGFFAIGHRGAGDQRLAVAARYLSSGKLEPSFGAQGEGTYNPLGGRARFVVGHYRAASQELFLVGQARSQNAMDAFLTKIFTRAL